MSQHKLKLKQRTGYKEGYDDMQHVANMPYAQTPPLCHFFTLVCTRAYVPHPTHAHTRVHTYKRTKCNADDTSVICPPPWDRLSVSSDQAISSIIMKYYTPPPPHITPPPSQSVFRRMQADDRTC
jgi:hypothetical protein